MPLKLSPGLPSRPYNYDNNHHTASLSTLTPTPLRSDEDRVSSGGDRRRACDHRHHPRQRTTQPAHILLALLISAGSWGLVAWAIATAAVDVESDVAEAEAEAETEPQA